MDAQHGLLMLDVRTLADSPNNPRRSLSPEGLRELADSIKAVGILQPIVVRPLAGRAKRGPQYEIVCGHRRAAGARLADVSHVPALVRDLDDRAALEAAITENVQREDMSTADEVHAVATLEQLGYGPIEIQTRLGRSARWVRDRVRLRNLVPDVAELLDRGLLPLAGAVLLATLPAETQSQWLADEPFGNDNPANSDCTPLSLADVQTEVRGLLRRLMDAPWALDDDRFGPTCAGCSRRTDAQTDLFGDLPAGDATWERHARAPRCLDSVCWTSKANRLVALEAESGALVVDVPPQGYVRAYHGEHLQQPTEETAVRVTPSGVVERYVKKAPASAEEPPWKRQERERAEQAKAEQARRDALLDELVREVAGAAIDGDVLWGAIVPAVLRIVAGNASQDAARVVLLRYGVATGQGTTRAQLVELCESEAVAAGDSDQADMVRIALLVEVLAAESVTTHGYAGDARMRPDSALAVLRAAVGLTDEDDTNEEGDAA